MMGPPRYLVIGGEIFDRVATAPTEQQQRFLTILHELRRNPLESTIVEIDAAKDWGAESAFIVDFEGLVVSYHVAGQYIVLIEAIWV